MKAKEILNNADHRPWPLPDGPWKFYQEWNRAIFLHWKVDLDELEKWVPKGLKIDLIEDTPWVSLVAFTMEKIRPRFLPAFPPISNFDEINIRTYVKHGHKTGVYFLSIEGGNRLSCKVAKSLSELPYRFSGMNRGQSLYQSQNEKNNDELEIRFTLGDQKTSKTPLDIWLTERYALFQDAGKSINEFEILHEEWPVQEIKIDNLKLDYKRFEKLISGPPDKVQYSKGVPVIAWGKRKLDIE